MMRLRERQGLWSIDKAQPPSFQYPGHVVSDTDTDTAGFVLVPFFFFLETSHHLDTTEDKKETAKYGTDT